MNKTVLNIGCGKTKLEEQEVYFKNWKEIRVDAFDNDTADIISSITDLKEIETESIDAIWASHVVEHCYFHELPNVFNSMMRVLKPNGFAIVSVPDLGSIANRISNGLLEPVYGMICPIDMIYGSRAHVQQGELGMAHKTGFTEKSMSQIISSLNIKALTRSSSYEIIAVLYKNEIPDYINA